MIITIKTSYRLAAIFALFHGGGAIIVLTLPVPGWARLGLVLLLGLSLYANLVRHALRHGPQTIRALEFDHGQWALRLNNGELRSDCTLCASHVHPRVVILRLCCRERRFPVNIVLSEDAVEPETFRRLRAQLRAHVPAA